FGAIAFTVLAMFVVALAQAAGGNGRWYWYSSLCAYIFSCLAGFSIGLLTLVFVLILLSLAIGHSLNHITSWKDTLFFTAAGIITWCIVLITIKSWIFSPLLF